MKQKKAINVQDKNVSQINIRNSNIELLRIISMLFIILGHFIMQGGIFENYRNTNHIFPYILGFGSSISVNIFLIIGTWFMVDKDFKSERVVKLYSQVFFYTTIITTILVVSGLSIPIKDIFRGYFPFFGRALWFSSAYITLMLLTPYLKRIFNIGEKKLYQLLCLMFVFISVVSTFPDLQQNYLCNTLWFAFVYF